MTTIIFIARLRSSASSLSFFGMVMDSFLKFPLVLFAIPAAYFNAVMICLLVKTLRRNGPIFNPLHAVKLLWSLLKILLKALLVGFVPAMLLSALVRYITPSWSLFSIFVVLLGTLLSAVLIHRVLLTKIVAQTKWNWAIAILTLFQIAASGSVFFFL